MSGTPPVTASAAAPQREQGAPAPSPPPSLPARLRVALADDLFPPAPRATLGPLGGLGLVAGWLGLVAASVLRQTGVSALDTVWAEDGVTFLRRALETSLADSLGEGYVGYLHVIPRFGAELAATAPLGRAATVMTLTSAGIVATGAVLVYAASAGHVRSRPLRMLLAAMVVVQPVVGVESLNSLSLVQWPLTFTAFWLALWRPSRTSALLVSGGALALIVLSAPLAVVVATPVLLVRSLVVVPGWRDRLPALLFGLGLALQVWVALTQPSPPSSGGTPGQLADAYGILVAEPGLFGLALGSRLRAVDAGAVRAAALLCWAVVVIAALLPRMPHRLTALAAAVASPAALVIGVYGRDAAPSVIATQEAGRGLAGARFAVVPILLLLSVLVLVLDTAPPRVPVGAWRQVAAGVAGALLLVAGMDFLVTNDRTRGPAWSQQVAEGVLGCRAGATQVPLQISPDLPSWQLEVACRDFPP